jgi:hypothetical protein
MRHVIDLSFLLNDQLEEVEEEPDPGPVLTCELVEYDLYRSSVFGCPCVPI